MHMKLLTGENLTKRGIIGPHRCPMCCNAPETTDHLFVDCPFAQEVWKISLQGLNITTLNHISVVNLFSSWKARYPQETQSSPNWKRIWQTIPKYICWKLWLARNDQIFNNTLPFPPSVVAKAKSLLLEIVASYSFKNEKNFLLAEKKWIGTFTFRKRNQISSRPYLTPPWRLRDKYIVLQDWWRRQDIAPVFFYEASKGNPGNAGAGRVIYFLDGSRKDNSS